MPGVSALRRSIAREKAPLSFSMLIAFSKWPDHPTRSSMALKCQSGPCRLFQHVYRIFTRGGFASGTEQPHEFARHDVPSQYQGRDAQRRSTCHEQEHDDIPKRPALVKPWKIQG